MQRRNTIPALKDPGAFSHGAREGGSFVRRTGLINVLLWCGVLVIASLLVAGCAARRHPISYLSEDKLASDQGYESIVLLRLHVIDRTIMTQYKERVGRFAFYDSIDVGPLSKHGISRLKDWKEKDGAMQYEGVFWAQAKAGDHSFRAVTFRSRSSSSSAGMTTTSSSWFSVPLQDTLLIQGVRDLIGSGLYS